MEVDQRMNSVPQRPITAEDIEEARAVHKRIAMHFIGTGTGRVLALFDQFVADYSVVPSGADAQRERDNWLRWLRLDHFTDPNVRTAAKAMIRVAKGAGPRSEGAVPMALHRVKVLNGGAFPSESTIRRAIEGVVPHRR